MNSDAFATSVRHRFRSPDIRTIFAQTQSDPIAISRIVTKPTVTERQPAEAAYLVHVQMGRVNSGEIYVDDRPVGLQPQHRGAVRILDMRSEPWARIDDEADFLRIQLSQRMLDDLAHDNGSRRVSLIRPRFNIDDPILHNLCTALVARFDHYGAEDSLFVDHVGLALHAHIVSTYADLGPSPQLRGGLSPSQMRRACDIMMDRMGKNPTIKELADACGLSISYFSRAFRETAGMPPHQWIMNQRHGRATELLRTSRLSLPEIALACGFSDQSHMTRVFRQKEGCSPGRWRRSRIE